MRIPGRLAGGLLLQMGWVAAALAGGGIADLGVTKTAPDTAAADTDVVYAIGIFNVGPNAAASVAVTDIIPPGLTFVALQQNAGPAFTCSTPPGGGGGTVTCTQASFAAGASADFSLTLHIPPATPPGTNFTNTATIASATFDPNGKNDASSTSTTTGSNFADLALIKGGPSVAGSGTTISYSLSVVNSGPDAAQSVVLSDPLPGTLTFTALTQDSGPAFSCTTPASGSNGTVTCTIATLAAGAGADFTLSASIPAGTPSGTTYTNTAGVASAQDPTPENDNSTVVTTVSSADLAVTKTGPANITAGQTITYSIVLTNNGPDTSIGASFNDLFPPNTTFASLVQNTGPTASCSAAAGSAACRIPILTFGASASFQIALAVYATTPNGAVLTNTANASADNFDPAGGNDSASSSATVANSVDLAVSKSGPASVVAGQSVNYTIILSNNGPDAAVGANFVDFFPAGTTFVSLNQTSGAALACSNDATTATCTTVAPLAAGASVTTTLVLQVPAATPNGTSLTNSVDAQSSTPESTPSNNSANSTAIVDASADLSITKTGPTAVSAGSTISYAIDVSNNGPVAASALNLIDALPASTTFVSLAQNSGPAFACSTPAVGTNGAIGCTAPALANGATASFTLTALVPAAVPGGTSLSNSASVSASTPDPVPANNSATAVAIVANAPDLALSKSGPSTVTAGQTASYVITLSNSGSTPATTVQLSDTLPGATTFVSLTQGSGPTFNCVTPAVGATGTVTCSIAALNNGDSVTFSLVVSVPTSLANGSTLTNSATATTTGSDVNNVNNLDSTTALVGNSADLVASKSGPPLAALGTTLTYSLGIVNNGTSPASAVQLIDSLPASTQFVSLVQNSGPIFSCTTPAVGATGAVTCSIASLAPGASASFSLRIGTAGLPQGTLANTATASSTTADADPGNNSATASVDLIPAPLTTGVPTLSTTGLLLLGVFLALLAWRRRHHDRRPARATLRR
ncbi:MAG: IPTL-CTERM sorting domain-containing protein [Tahibacter sp.]